MRNTPGVLIVTVFSIGLAGCETTPRPTELDRARTALLIRDYPQAQTSAETYLTRDPTGARAAEAYYLKGRALEDRTATSAQAARENLQAARMAYIGALKAGPADKTLEGLIRASLSDVAYWQEDFATAAEQGQAAYAMLQDNDTRAWTLYRTGVSQQRLGRFDEADKTLQMVQEYHAGSEPAQRAVSRVGVRSFNVQVATFSQPATAENAIKNLTRQGFGASRKSIAGGKTVVLAGPYKTWGQAAGARSRLTAWYPDALIVP